MPASMAPTKPQGLGIAGTERYQCRARAEARQAPAHAERRAAAETQDHQRRREADDQPAGQRQSRREMGEIHLHGREAPRRGAERPQVQTEGRIIGAACQAGA